VANSANAQLAVGMYEALRQQYGWTAKDAWHGIARLLLTCEVWNRGWQPLSQVVIYRESNDFKTGPRGPSATLRRADSLTTFLAHELGVARNQLCQTIATYWRNPLIAALQPHNLAGHAFRSIVVHALKTWGDSGITYEEEVSPHKEFPGQTFATRSKEPRIDIVARRSTVTVALISSRWRFRHDRVDVVEEAMAYAPAATRHNPKCQLYACVGEFSPNRLDKILSNCPPLQPRGALSATVHFAPTLITHGLRENGRMQHLKSLEWLIAETHRW
jgi:hypothetical protein